MPNTANTALYLQGKDYTFFEGARKCLLTVMDFKVHCIQRCPSAYERTMIVNDINRDECWNYALEHFIDTQQVFSSQEVNEDYAVRDSLLCSFPPPYPSL